jgi:hypothetical protein
MRSIKRLTRTFLAITMVLGIWGYGQVTYGQSDGSAIGLQAGLNISNYGGDAETDSRIGFHLGANTLVEVNQDISLQPGIQLSLQGANASGSSDVTENQWYINIPLPLRYELNDEFALKAGPYLGLLLSSKTDGNNSVDTKEYYKSFDFGLQAGLGYSVTNEIEIGINYNLGLMNINDLNPDNFTVNNRVLQFTVTYML